MSDTPATPPRRIAPQMGLHVWQADTLTPSDWMIPVGAEASAEIMAMAEVPVGAVQRVLGPVLREVTERCDHGHGMVLLRGLPPIAREKAPAALGLLGDALGEPLVAPQPAGGGVPGCDIFLIGAIASVELSLVSAGAAHNALLLADRAALEPLYRPLAEGVAPVFTARNGVFAGRFDPGKGARGPMVPLAAVCADPALPLRVTLRAGDVLCLNSFLVWPFLSEPGVNLAESLLVQPLRMPVSRMEEAVAPVPAPDDIGDEA